jgi:hypothetical protein
MLKMKIGWRGKIIGKKKNPSTRNIKGTVVWYGCFSNTYNPFYHLLF